MDQPDFKIENRGPVSAKFLENNIADFPAAMLFIKKLPYARNANKRDLTTVFSDGCGTCSTKHALLKELANENGFKDLQLITGLFKMHSKNTPAVRLILEDYNLEYIPEAHTYLKHEGEIIDCTKMNRGAADFIQDILEETEIAPGQITDHKVSYHKNYLEKWLGDNPQLRYSPAEIWAIRERCITALS